MIGWIASLQFSQQAWHAFLQVFKGKAFITNIFVLLYKWNARVPAYIIGGFVFVYFVSTQVKVSSCRFLIFRPIKPLLCASFVTTRFEPRSGNWGLRVANTSSKIIAAFLHFVFHVLMANSINGLRVRSDSRTFFSPRFSFLSRKRPGQQT